MQRIAVQCDLAIPTSLNCRSKRGARGTADRMPIMSSRPSPRFRSPFLLCFASRVACTTASRTAPSPGLASVAFAHATVIDVRDGGEHADQTVVVAGHRIVKVGPSNRVALPPNVRVVDARGKYLIPGLWDMHAHALRQDRIDTFLPLYVGNGVTGVRDIGISGLPNVDSALADFERSKRTRYEIAARVGAIPRIVAAGVIVSGNGRVWPSSIEVTDTLAARRAVTTLKARGADFIKVYNFIPRDAYFALAREARKQRMSFVGHAPDFASLAEASDSGQRSVEHLGNLLVACSLDEERIETQIRNLIRRLDDPRPEITRLRNNTAAELLTGYNDAKADSLFARLARNRTWQVPTLIVIKTFANLTDSAFTRAHKDEWLRYIPATLRETLSPAGDWRQRVRTESPQIVANQRKLFDKSLELVGKMQRAGVPILAGTDVPPLSATGFNLHDELALLVQAGLTPAEALRTATWNPARFLGRERDLGTIEEGKLADLVLLDDDPLADVSSTRRIRGVMVDGRYFDRAALDDVLAQVERSAR